MSNDGLEGYAQTDEIEIEDCTKLTVVSLKNGRCSPIDFDKLQRWQVSQFAAVLGLPSHVLVETLRDEAGGTDE